jgi:predicted amidophosphoribosyltransferase
VDFKEFGICPKCRDSIKTAVSITYRGRLQIFAGSVYTSDLSRVILAAKEENQIQARIFLARQLSQSLEKALKDISIKRSQRIEDVVIIPIPSSKSADRRRGFAHIELLVNQLMEMNETLNIKVLNCLSHSRKILDQTSLNFNERAMNMKGAFVVDQVMHFEFYPIKNSNSAVFLVDDLVTSGATVQAADLALSTLGARVDGVLASCATPGFTH